MEGTSGNNKLKWFCLSKKKKNENKNPAKLSDLTKVKEVAIQKRLILSILPHIKQDRV